MQTVVRSEVDVAVPAAVAWRHLTDWSRQGEWIPMTKVAAVDSADGVGGRIKAWTGLGRVGFWDTMTITAWDVADDEARCEVLHTGRVVRGEGEFAVTALGPDECRFTWWERLEIPGGQAGGVAWRAVGPLFSRMVDTAVRRFAVVVEDAHGHA